MLNYGHVQTVSNFFACGSEVSVSAITHWTENSRSSRFLKIDISSVIDVNKNKCKRRQTRIQHFLNSVWMLCITSKCIIFIFSHRRKLKVPSSSQVRKTNVNKRRLFLALSKDCFCWRQRSHRCFIGQTISRCCWPQRCRSGQYLYQTCKIFKGQ